MTAICRTCGAPILWAHTRHGMRLPVDPIPVSGGNLELIMDQPAGPVAVYVEATDEIRHVSHFATCPDATRHRRRTKTSRRSTIQ